MNALELSPADRLSPPVGRWWSLLPAIAALSLISVALSMLACRPLAQQLAIIENLRAAVFWLLPVPLLIGIVLTLRQRITQQPINTRWIVGICLCFAISLLAARASNGAAALLKERSLQTIRVSPQRVAINGAIAPDLLQRLQDTLDPRLPIDTVELANAGGDPSAAIAAATWLRGRGVQRAVITGPCASACAYMALLFPQRDLQQGGSLGFHAALSYTGNREEAARAQDQLRHALVANGIPADTVAVLFSTAAVRWMPTDELVTRGLITRCLRAATDEPAPCATPH